MQVTVVNSENGKDGKMVPAFSRTNPFVAKVLKNVNLNGTDSRIKKQDTSSYH